MVDHAGTESSEKTLVSKNSGQVCRQGNSVFSETLIVLSSEDMHCTAALIRGHLLVIRSALGVIEIAWPRIQ